MSSLDIGSRFAGVVAALLLAACGGDRPTTPGADTVVASVAVGPASPTLVEGDSVRLSATPRNASGVALTGKTVSWSSSAITVATVSDKGVVTGVTSGTATITATVDGATGTLDIVVNKGVPLVLEMAQSANDSIGPAGGSITATAASGLVYTLTVPPNALATPRRITMTPVKTIRTLPLTGGVLGAVDLQPAGLRFTKPVHLRIAAATTAPAGMHLIGFSFEQQGDSVRPKIVADSGGSATVLLTHFSGGGAVFGSQSDIAAFVQDRNNQSHESDLFIDSLIVLSTASPPDLAAELQVLRNWFNQHIIPEIQLAETDSALGVAIVDYHLAIEAELAFGISASSVLGPEKDAAAAAIAPKLRQAIADENSVCLQQRDITAAANALFWQTQAADFGVDTPAEQLDRTTVLFNLCISVVFTRSDYPDPAVANTQGTLDVRAGMQFGTDPNLALELFTWRTVVTGSTADGTLTGNSDTSGGFTTLITPTGAATLEMRVHMCIFDNQLPYVDVCTNRTVTRPFGVTLTGDVFVQTQTGLQSLVNVSKIVGNLSIFGNATADPVSTTDFRELSQLEEVTGNLTISSSKSVQRLDGLHSLKRVGGQLSLQFDGALADMSGLSSLADLGGLTLSADSALTAITGLTNVTSLDAQGLSVTSMPALSNIGGLSGLRSAQQIVLQSTPHLSSLQALRGVVIRDAISIVDMAGLASISDLTGISGAMTGRVNFQQNPLLSDFSVLSALHSAASVTIIGGANADVGFLNNLEQVPGVISFAGPQLANVTLPSLTRSGSISISLDSPHLSTVSFPALQDGSLSGSNGLIISGNLCGSGSVSVDLPSLTTTSVVQIGTGSIVPPDCSIRVNALRLATVTSGIAFGGGVSSFTLAPTLTTVQLSIDGTSTTRLDLPVLDVQTLRINANPQLTTLGSGSGKVTFQTIITNNPNLPQSDANAYANNFSPHGTLHIFGNKP
jgi:hypothetical protein